MTRRRTDGGGSFTRVELPHAPHKIETWMRCKTTAKYDVSVVMGATHSVTPFSPLANKHGNLEPVFARAAFGAHATRPGRQESRRERVVARGRQHVKALA